MHFELPEITRELQARLEAFMRDHILPANPRWIRAVENGEFPPPWLEALKHEARAQGLWNLFLPGLREGRLGNVLKIRPPLVFEKSHACHPRARIKR